MNPVPWVSTKQDDRGPKADLTVTLHFCHWFPTSFNFESPSIRLPALHPHPWLWPCHGPSDPCTWPAWSLLSLMDLAVDPPLWSSTQDRHRRLTLVTALAWDSFRVSIQYVMSSTVYLKGKISLARNRSGNYAMFIKHEERCRLGGKL